MRLETLEKFDRRWIFAIMGVAIVVGVLVPIGLPSKASAPVKSIYYTIEALPQGATVAISVDLDPAAAPELEPFFRSVVLQLKRKKAKLDAAAAALLLRTFLERERGTGGGR